MSTCAILVCFLETVSTLTLVRHGQSFPFQGERAALTATGEAQAEALARFWRRHEVRFDEVYCGALPRQVRTAEVVANALGWPAAVCDPAWNEYDAPGILRDQTMPREHREFQRMFEAAMLRWLEGSSDGKGAESWPAFRERVSGAIARIMAGQPSRSVAVFTSGGPIGFTVHQAMQAPAKSFLDVNWRVRNGSFTQFVFDRNRLTLDGFNAIPHLEEEPLWTYR